MVAISLFYVIFARDFLSWYGYVILLRDSFRDIFT